MDRTLLKLRVAPAFVGFLLLLCVVGVATAAAGTKAEIKAALATPPTASMAVAQCSTGETRRFREETTGMRGARALKACEEEARSPLGRNTSVKTSNIKVRGRKATAHVQVFGNELQGQILEVGLIKVGGRWKADEVLGFFHLDRNALIKVLKEAFSEPGDHIPKKVAECICSGLRKAPSEKITEWFFGVTNKAAKELYGPCIRRL